MYAEGDRARNVAACFRIDAADRPRNLHKLCYYIYEYVNVHIAVQLCGTPLVQIYQFIELFVNDEL
jgi:hypothetical protein